MVKECNLELILIGESNFLAQTWLVYIGLSISTVVCSLHVNWNLRTLILDHIIFFFIVTDLPLIGNLAPKISLSCVGCGTGFIQTSWKCVQ